MKIKFEYCCDGMENEITEKKFVIIKVKKDSVTVSPYKKLALYPTCPFCGEKVELIDNYFLIRIFE